jgi:gamma-glutamylcyclotransferase
LTTHYFAYGSNMVTTRLRKRVPSARVLGPARLADFAWRCDKRGRDGTAKANLAPEPGAETWGVLFEVDPAELPALDRAEGGYERVPVEVTCAGRSFAAETYVSDRVAADWLPTAWYRDVMLRGAREHGLPPHWIARLEAVEPGPPTQAPVPAPTPARDAAAADRIAFDDPANRCFGCSPHNPRGLRLSFERRGRGVVETDYVAAPELCGMDGVIHGGVQAALLDEAMGFAVHAAFDDRDESDVATIELSLRYRRMAPTGQPLRIRGEFVRAEGRDVWVRGEIRDGAGRLCTEAESRWRRLGARAPSPPQPGSTSGA